MIHEHTLSGLVQLRACLAQAVLTIGVMTASPTTEPAVLPTLAQVEEALMELRAQVNEVIAGGRES